MHARSGARKKKRRPRIVYPRGNLAASGLASLFATCVKRGAESEKRCKDYRAFAAGPLVAWTTALTGARKTVVEILTGGEFRR